MPRSTCCRTRVVVNTLVTDPNRNPVSSRIGAPVATFAVPWATIALLAVVIDAGKIPRHLARLTIGGGLLANLCRDSLEQATTNPGRTAA